MTAIIKKSRTFAATLAAIALVAGLAVVPALAHHSFTAEFDQNKPIKLTGKITMMKWSNPHGWLYIDVTGADGKVVNWALETGAGNSLIRRGWRKDNLPVGKLVTVQGWQARNGSHTANVNSVLFEDGTRLFAGSSNGNAEEK